MATFVRAEKRPIRFKEGRRGWARQHVYEDGSRTVEMIVVTWTATGRPAHLAYGRRRNNFNHTRGFDELHGDWTWAD